MVPWLLVLMLEVPLAETHRAWIETEVPFLLSERGRKDFLALPTDSARDRFIEDFWRKRGARAEHQARLADADRLFTTLRSQPGRLTERGRVYQLLGPPQSREDFSYAPGVFPLELWHYTGVTESFLPGTFYLIFVRKGGWGEYWLWSPTVHGPESLIRANDPGRWWLSRESSYDALREVDLELALAAERLVPGEDRDAPMASDSLLANLKSYADLKERDLATQVTAHVSFLKIPLAFIATPLVDTGGIPRVQYALEIAPESVVWRKDGPRARARFNLICRVLDRERRQVWVQDDNIELEGAASGEQRPLRFQGSLGVAPGDYTLEAVLVQPTTGAASSVSQSVEVRDPEGAGVGALWLARPVAETRRAGTLSELGDVLYSPSLDLRFPPTEARAVLQVWGMTEGGEIHWSLRRSGETLWRTTSVVPSPAVTTLQETIPLTGLPDGTYALEAETPAGNRRVDLQVVSGLFLPSVRVLARDDVSPGHARLERGRQFARRGETSRAIVEMTEAARLLPRDLDVHLKLGYLLSVTSRHEKVIDLLEPWSRTFTREPDLLVLLGFAWMKLGRLDEAASYYERALELRPDDPRVKRALEEARQARR